VSAVSSQSDVAQISSRKRNFSILNKVLCNFLHALCTREQRFVGSTPSHILIVGAITHRPHAVGADATAVFQIHRRFAKHNTSTIQRRFDYWHRGVM